MQLEQVPSHLIFLGGEPTLHPALPEAVEFARSNGVASLTIDTNGYLFNDILNKVTPSEVDFFSFSLDGVSARTNDRIRGRGAFKTCVEGIRQTVGKGFNASLIYTVSRQNILELEKIAPLLQELKISRFFIQVIGLRGRAADRNRSRQRKPSLQVAASEWLRMIPRFARQIADLGITVTYPKVFLKPHEPFACAGLVSQNYFVFPNGRVYQCPLCEDYPLHSLMFKDNQLLPTAKINESDLFELNIPEGCVMNRLIQPYHLRYDAKGNPEYKIGCCLLKEEVGGEK